MDAPAFKKNLAAIGLEETGNDLDGGRLARAIRADVADNFAGAEAEADVFDGGKTAVALAEGFDLEHGDTSHTLCSI
jgi:hypothetical protein